jgi:hypothetical protein
MLLTEAHRRRNEFMAGRAGKVFGPQRRSVADALRQYDRIARGSTRTRRTGEDRWPGVVPPPKRQPEGQ